MKFCFLEAGLRPTLPLPVGRGILFALEKSKVALKRQPFRLGTNCLLNVTLGKPRPLALWLDCATLRQRAGRFSGEACGVRHESLPVIRDLAPRRGGWTLPAGPCGSQASILASRAARDVALSSEVTEWTWGALLCLPCLPRPPNAGREAKLLCASASSFAGDQPDDAIDSWTVGDTKPLWLPQDSRYGPSSPDSGSSNRGAPELQGGRDPATKDVTRGNQGSGVRDRSRLGPVLS